MNYKNAKDIIPPRLLAELQKYIEGEIIYIPKKDRIRAGWGQTNGTRLLIDGRNNEIYKLYSNGLQMEELSELFSLSMESIRKIVFKVNQRESKIEG